MRIPQHLVDRLDEELQNKGLKNVELRAELQDHFLCFMEQEMVAGASLQEAEQRAFRELGEMDLKGMNRQTFFIHHQNSILMASFCALLITFTTFFSWSSAEEIATIDPPKLWPIAADQYSISSGFGYRMFQQKKRFHKGIDLKAPIGTPIYAPENALVLETGYTDKKGHYIILEHDEIYQTKYYHLSEISVKKGEAVLVGDPIGKTGNTGLSTAPHLHYEVLKNGVEVDPAEYLQEQQTK